MKKFRVTSDVALKCTSCGKEYFVSEGSFNKSASSLFKGNGGYLPVCKKCLRAFYENYLSVFQGDEKKAIKMIAIMFDLPFSEDIIEAAKRRITPIQKTLFGAFLVVISKTPYNTHTFLDYIDGTIDDNTNKSEKKENKRKNNKGYDIKEIPEYTNNWGVGFTSEEYVMLQNRYDEWKSKVIIDSMTRESLVRDLCVIKLQQQKALQDNNVDMYNRLQRTYQDTLSSANLKPIQEEEDKKEFEKPFGVLIEMFENEDPIPHPLPEWRDVDGIVRLFTIYFIGHLCKMLNIKNRYANMYEEEMQKYRVTIDEPEEMSDEDVFEYLTENGFTEGSNNPNEVNVFEQ